MQDLDECTVLNVPTVDDLPLGRPIRGNGWAGTLLVKSQNGVAHLELQGVISTVPQAGVWDEITRLGYTVSSDCQWFEVSREMAMSFAQ